MKVRKHILLHPDPDIRATLPNNGVVATYEFLEITDDEFDTFHINPDTASMIEAAQANTGDVIVEVVNHIDGTVTPS